MISLTDGLDIPDLDIAEPAEVAAEVLTQVNIDVTPERKAKLARYCKKYKMTRRELLARTIDNLPD